MALGDWQDRRRGGLPAAALRSAGSAGSAGSGALLRRLRGWWHLLHLGARLMVLALSPATYRGAVRRALSRQIVHGAAASLPWFTVLSALLSVVLIHIVSVTATSYGLSQYALEMVVRVLVLELIPLSAALFVALRVSLPQGAELIVLRRRSGLDARAMRVPPRLAEELLPRVLAGLFAVPMLALVSGVLALVLAYLSLHGFTPWALAGYTRTVGHVFEPAVALIFLLKTAFFSLIVALVPVASAVDDAPPERSRTRAELDALVRMFTLLLIVELASLVGNYY
jgi:phospholipid/cholesterol/gamma-HCH transport system permease protein